MPLATERNRRTSVRRGACVSDLSRPREALALSVAHFAAVPLSFARSMTRRDAATSSCWFQGDDTHFSPVVTYVRRWSRMLRISSDPRLRVYVCTLRARVWRFNPWILLSFYNTEIDALGLFRTLRVPRKYIVNCKSDNRRAFDLISSYTKCRIIMHLVFEWVGGVILMIVSVYDWYRYTGDC